MHRKEEMRRFSNRFLRSSKVYLGQAPRIWENCMRTTLLICSLLYAAVFVAPAGGQQHVAGNRPLAKIRYRGRQTDLRSCPGEWTEPSLVHLQYRGAEQHHRYRFGAAPAHRFKVQRHHSWSRQRGYSCYDAGEVELTIGGLGTRVSHAKIVDLSKVPLPAIGYGLIGAEFLEQYAVRIDPVAHNIAFYDPKTFVYVGDGKSLPLELTNSRLYVQIGLAAKPNELAQRKLRVDTGSEDSIDDATIRSSPVTQKTTLGNGLGNSYEDLSGVYDTVVIGPVKFWHVWGPAGAVAIIGMEMMRRFTLTFDARRGLLYLEPNSTFDEPFPAPG